MKAILVSEPALTAIRDKLVADLSRELSLREQRVSTGEMTGLSPTPERTVNYHVCMAFDALRDA